jgi:hypothetical protein
VRSIQLSPLNKLEIVEFLVFPISVLSVVPRLIWHERILRFVKHNFVTLVELVLVFVLLEFVHRRQIYNFRIFILLFWFRKMGCDHFRYWKLRLFRSSDWLIHQSFQYSESLWISIISYLVLANRAMVFDISSENSKLFAEIILEVESVHLSEPELSEIVIQSLFTYSNNSSGINERYFLRTCSFLSFPPFSNRFNCFSNGSFRIPFFSFSLLLKDD